MRRLVAIAIGVTLALAVSCVPVSFASAREYTTPTPEDFTAAGGPEEDYAMVKNPDGTYTEYYAEAGNTDNYAQYLKGNTYSGQAIEEADRVAAEEAVDEGTTGQDGSIVFGSDGDNLYAAEIGVDELRTGLPYASTAEADLGDSMITEGIEADTLPTTGAVAAGLAGTILTAGGAIAAGIGISVGLDELVGVPSFLDIFNEAKVEGGCGGETLMIDCKYETGWYTGRVKMGEVSGCEYESFLYPYPMEQLPGTLVGELCEFPQLAENFHWEYKEKGGKCGGEDCVYETTCNDVWLVGGRHGGIGGLFDGEEPGCRIYEPEGKPKYEESTETEHQVPTYCPPAPAWLSCFQAFSGPEGTVYSEPSGGYNLIAREGYAPLSTLMSYDGFPAAGLSEHESHVETPTGHSLEALAPVKTPVEVPPPDEIPDFRRHHIIEKAKKPQTAKEKEEKVPPVPLIPPLEKGNELPSPLEPTVPQITPNEDWTEYKEAVEKAGLTPNENVLPETAIDPAVGPNDVTAADPAPGSREAPGTGVTVDVNPSNAPIPGEAPHGIGPPTEPGFDLPKLGVLCHGFPFGVPCWLVSTIVAMSTTAKAPDWTIVPEIEVSGHKVHEGKFDFAKLEPIMEIVRPAMIAFTTIGIVLLFYSFAKGGGPPSGGNADSAPMSEPDDDVYL